MRSECAHTHTHTHKAEHTLQKHVKESVKLLLLHTLGFLQHRDAGKKKKVCAPREIRFASIKKALSFKLEILSREQRCGNDCAAYFLRQSTVSSQMEMILN